MKKLKLRPKLIALRADAELLERMDCTPEENDTFLHLLEEEGGELPEGVYRYQAASTDLPLNSFYRVRESDLSEAEKQEFILLKQYTQIKTIKKYVVFFTILAVISLLLFIYISFLLLNA
ncbi:MAG: hypothetical protein IJN34_07850 [Clostridia bacterium]|nr:hypothetical protein [Clostridia bacterium]